MLKQRIITAIALLAAFQPALWLPSPIPFAAMLLGFTAAAAWEWGQLNGLNYRNSVAFGGIFAGLCAATWMAGWLWQPLPWLWTIGALLWMVGGAWLLHAGVAGWQRLPRTLRLAVGLLVLWLAWLAVAQARIEGVNYLLSVLALVWMADIAAYFTGRAFGGRWIRRKLAANISPGKSWEGAIGGMLGVLLLAVCWIGLDLYRGEILKHDIVISFYMYFVFPHWWILPLVLALMTAMSVVGDLVESLIKRSAGVKDSSNLLPGHGGILDRIDALLPTLPIAMLLAHTALVYIDHTWGQWK